MCFRSFQPRVPCSRFVRSFRFRNPVLLHEPSSGHQRPRSDGVGVGEVFSVFQNLFFACELSTWDGDKSQPKDKIRRFRRKLTTYGWNWSKLTFGLELVRSDLTAKFHPKGLPPLPCNTSGAAARKELEASGPAIDPPRGRECRREVRRPSVPKCREYRLSSHRGHGCLNRAGTKLFKRGPRSWRVRARVPDAG